MRSCKRCGLEKSAVNFTPFEKGKNGLYPYCKECRKVDSKKYWKEKSLVNKIYERAKSRANKKNLEFNIETEDIVIPELCPVFNVPLKGRYCASIDRIDSSKGYIKGNIQIISNRANILKNDGSLREFEQLVEFLKI